MINLQDYLRFLTENKMKPEKFFMLLAIFKFRRGENKELLTLLKSYKDLFGYDYLGNKVIVDPAIIEELVDDGYLVRNEAIPGIKYDLTNKSASFFVDFEAIYELYEAYPAFVQIKHQTIPLKTGNIAENTKYYFDAIKNDATLHRKILEAVEFGKQRKLIKVNISNFIASRSWTDLFKLMHTAPKTTDNKRAINKNL